MCETLFLQFCIKTVESLFLLEKVKSFFVSIISVYLTKSEQRLLEVLPAGAFSVDEIKGFDFRYKVELLSRLARKKAIQRIKKGVYFLQRRPAEARLEAALALHNGYLGFATALKHYGGLDEELSRVFVCTEKNRGVKNFEQFDVEFIPMHSDFYGIIQEQNIRWSTKAKTVFDCLKKPRVVGYRRVLQAVERIGFSKEDWTELLYYLRLSSKSLRQKAGFLLKTVAPDWFLRSLGKSIQKNAVARLNFGEERGFDKKWGVYYGVSDS